MRWGRNGELNKSRKGWIWSRTQCRQRVLRGWGLGPPWCGERGARPRLWVTGVNGQGTAGGLAVGEGATGPPG